MLLDISKLYIADLLGCGVILVALIFAFLGDKKGETRVWRQTDFICLVIYGLAAYFFPSLFLGYLTVGKLDSIHLYLFQLLGAGSIGLAVVSYRQNIAASQDGQVTSQDGQVTRGWLLSRVMGFTFLMVNGVHGKLSLAKEDVRFADQLMTSTGTAFGLLLIGSMVKLWQHYSSQNGGGHSSPRGEPYNSLNQQHLLVAILLILPVFILYFGMPVFVFEFYGGAKYDNLHLHIVRSVACMGLTYVLQEMTALEFDSDRAKREFFIGHIVAVVLTLPLVLLSQLKHSLFSTSGLCGGLISLLLILGNSVYAVCKYNKDKKY